MTGDEYPPMVQTVTAPSLEKLVGALQPVIGRIVDSGGRPQSISHAYEHAAVPDERWSALVVALNRSVG